MQSESQTNATARADALGPLGLTGLYGSMLLVSLAYNFAFILVDYVRPFLVRDLHFTLSQTALLYGVQAGGVLAGALLAAVQVSAFGARRVLIAASVAMAASTALLLRSASPTMWFVMRLLCGLSMSGAYVASITLLVNCVPPRRRGRLLSINMSMFSVALLVAGAVGSAAGNWRVLVVLAALLPALAAAVAAVLAPDDRGMLAYSDHNEAPDTPVVRGRWSEMLLPGRRSIALRCLLMAGLNFSAYQFYSGFITTYLLQVRQFPAETVGLFVAVDGLGTLAGSALWGALADRSGRRFGALAIAGTAPCILLFLWTPARPQLLLSIECLYAVCLAATNSWAVYFAELFPVRLRPMGTALFHGGHVISLGAPLLVATLAAGHSLALGMSLAPLSFLAVAALWWSLPETLRSARRFRGFDADAAVAAPAGGPGRSAP